jgi:transposase
VHDESTADEIAKLRADVEHYRELYLTALEQCRKLERGLLGPKRERLPPNEAQLSMAVLGQMLGDRAAAAAMVGADDEPAVDKVREHERRKPTGRRPLSDTLPRVDIEIVPPEVEREGRDAFERIGEEISETVERRPSSLVVVRVRRPKFVRKDRERNAETEVLVGEVPELPIPRGLGGPGLLADTIVRRWQDHLPLHRSRANLRA